MIDFSLLVLCDVVVHCFEICSAVGSGYSKPIKLQKDVVQETRALSAWMTQKNFIQYLVST